MRRLMMPALLALTVPALTGCPGSPMGMSSPPTGYPMPVPYPTPGPMMPQPMSTSSPAYPVPIIPPIVADGPSMDDAYHYVQRYVTVHYPSSEIVAIRASQVGIPGRIAKSGAWSFTYRVPQGQPATGSIVTQAIDIPSQFDSRQLTFRLNGKNELFAPEVTERATLLPLTYDRVIPLGKAIEACQGFGMAIGPGGVSVALVSDALDGVYYEVDNRVGYQGSASTPGNYDSVGGYVQPGYVHGTYRIDALNGKLLERLSTP